MEQPDETVGKDIGEKLHSLAQLTDAFQFGQVQDPDLPPVDGDYTLTQKHIRGRLAESLIFLKDTYGYEDDNKTIKIYLSREDVANLSNMTTSNAIRTLSTFAQEGVISIDGRKIRILDLPKLERISELG